MALGKIIQKKVRHSIGIDIGTSSLKIIGVRQIPKSLEFDIIEGAYSSIENDSLQNTKKYLESLISTLGIARGSEVIVNVPNNSVITRYIMMPKMRNEELRKAINFELEKYISFDTQDAIYDFQILEENSQEQAKSIRVLLIITRKDTVLERVKILDEIGLNLKVVSINSIALKNVFTVNYPEKTKLNIALVDIGAKLTSIHILKNGLSNFMRDVLIGGDDITTIISEKLDLNKPDAESFKLGGSTDNIQKYNEIIMPVFSSILNELYLSFDYYESQFEKKIDELYLAGGSSLLSGLREYLEKSLGIKVFLLDPFIKIRGKDLLQTKSNIDPNMFAVTIGLALEDYF